MTAYAPVWNPETEKFESPRCYLSAAQGGVGTVVHFATVEQAMEDFDERKKFHGFARGRWDEIEENLAPAVLRKAVWSSIRKDGRPGKMRHTLHIVLLGEN